MYCFHFLSQKQSILDANTDLAQKLPPSLYVIYYQAIVYSSSHSDRLEVSIIGDKEEAERFLITQSKQNSLLESEKVATDVLLKHPLAILFTIKPKNSALPPVQIRFHYLTELKIVTGMK